MTYLDLVNNVLRRMREDEVSNVSENTYSKMVGDFVNDAKKLVENTWDWSALRTVKTISTVDGTYVYAITDSKDTYKDLTVVNDTDNIFMEYRPQSWFEEQYFINTQPKDLLSIILTTVSTATATLRSVFTLSLMLSTLLGLTLLFVTMIL